MMVVKPSDEKLAEFCSQFNWYAQYFGLDNAFKRKTKMKTCS